MDGDIEPGIYQFTEEERGAAAAEVEQKRAEILENLRTSKCFTTSILDNEGGVLHSSFILGLKKDEMIDAVTFLSYACLKVIKDLSEVLDCDMDQTLQMLRVMVDDGVGKDW